MAPISDLAAFRAELKQAQNILVLTGAGVSAASGVPTFRGAGGFWRRFAATSLATPSAFDSDPSLVWEFYHYRRELVKEKQPNDAHKALVSFEQWCNTDGRRFTLVTQNVDDLHLRAGSVNVVRLHGSLYHVRCIKCGYETQNTDSPICESLRDKGAPDAASPANIAASKLPRCTRCAGLLRPAIVWFNESLRPHVESAADRIVKECDMCLLIGTSSVVYPAAMYAPLIAERGVTVAEFNIESTPATGGMRYYFDGPAEQTIVKALKLPL